MDVVLEDSARTGGRSQSAYVCNQIKMRTFDIYVPENQSEGFELVWDS